eukprot:968960-Ditylum_brightwellii.AAC.1
MVLPSASAFKCDEGYQGNLTPHASTDGENRYQDNLTTHCSTNGAGGGDDNVEGKGGKTEPAC